MKPRILYPLLTIALVLAAPSTVRAQDHAHEPMAESMVIEVAMDDHLFSPTELRVPAGHQVTLLFTNAGDEPHEFMAGRGVGDGDFTLDLFEGLDVMMSQDAEGASHEHDTDAAPHDHAETTDEHGTMVMVAPGESASMSFTLPTDRLGEWDIACFIRDHYEQGMHGTIVVY